VVRGRGAGGGAEKEGGRRKRTKKRNANISSLFPLSLHHLFSLPIRYEYPFERFEEVATAYVGFLRDFAARHNGWKVTGAAVYFVVRVRRERRRDGGREKGRGGVTCIHMYTFTYVLLYLFSRTGAHSGETTRVVLHEGERL
jgi:hypothetical protein